MGQLVSLAHDMISTIFCFFKASLQSEDANGFGACFEMGQKCYWMPAL